MVQQVIANGVIQGAFFALVAVGMVLTRRLRGFYDFSHGAVVMVGAYSAYFVVREGTTSFSSAVCAAIAASIAVGSILEVLVFRPLRRIHDNELRSLVASLGVLVAAEAALAIIFGQELVVMPTDQPGRSWHFIATRLSQGQIATLAWGGCMLIGWCFLRYTTRFGLVVRALGDNRQLAVVRGVHVFRLTWVGVILAAATAGLAGALQLRDTGIVPGAGFETLLSVVVVVILSERRGIATILIVSSAFGMLNQCAVYILANGWQQISVFLVLAVYVWMFRRPDYRRVGQPAF